MGGGEGHIPSNSTKIASIKCHLFILRNYEPGKFYHRLLLYCVRTSYNVALDFNSILLIFTWSTCVQRFVSHMFLVVLKEKNFNIIYVLKKFKWRYRNSIGDKFEFTFFSLTKIYFYQNAYSWHIRRCIERLVIMDYSLDGPEGLHGLSIDILGNAFSRRVDGPRNLLTLSGLLDTSRDV